VCSAAEAGIGQAILATDGGGRILNAAMARMNRLLWCGVIAGPLFVGVFLVEGATRAGYDPVRLPVSLLSLGEGGWMQIVNFLVNGALLLALAIGVRDALRERAAPSTWGPLLLAGVAAGTLGAGIFSTDPGGGYPPGVSYEPSLHGTLHDLVSLVIFLGLPAAVLVFARWFARRDERGWAVYSALTGLVFVAGFGLMLVGFNAQNDLSRVAGLIQRIDVAIGWGWIALFAIYLLRQRSVAVSG
jgi:hypothetical protein